MIDWLSLIFPVNIDICGGKCVHLDANGEIEYSTDKFLPVSGSYSSIVQVKSIFDTKTPKASNIDRSFTKSPFAMRLYISGNPTKFLQGHNIWGFNDLQGMVYCFVKSICESLKLDADTTSLLEQCAYTGKYEITRIDITESFTLSSIGDVRAWIRAAAQVGTGRNQSVNSYKERTLYLGKNSRRMSIKVYAKGDEIQKHPFDSILLERMVNKHIDRIGPLKKMMSQDDVITHFDAAKTLIQEYTDKLLRVEVTLRGMALKDMGLNKGAFWRDGMLETVFADKIKKLELPENASLSATDILSLPLHLQGYLAMWQSGHNLKEHMTKPTYYRVRSQLKEHGIDIKSPPAGQKNNVVPLIKVITAEPAVIPQFAYEHDLVYLPHLPY